MGAHGCSGPLGRQRDGYVSRRCCWQRCRGGANYWTVLRRGKEHAAREARLCDLVPLLHLPAGARRATRGSARRVARSREMGSLRERAFGESAEDRGGARPVRRLLRRDGDEPSRCEVQRDCGAADHSGCGGTGTSRSPRPVSEPGGRVARPHDGYGKPPGLPTGKDHSDAHVPISDGSGTDVRPGRAVLYFAAHGVDASGGKIDCEWTVGAFADAAAAAPPTRGGGD